MKISYSIGVKTNAGWRSVSIVAIAEKVSPGFARVLSVETIAGESPSYRQSRTGAKRQEFSGAYFAGEEVGKKKRISACEILEN
jgi:hypothetical protein